MRRLVVLLAVLSLLLCLASAAAWAWGWIGGGLCVIGRSYEVKGRDVWGYGWCCGVQKHRFLYLYRYKVRSRAEPGAEGDARLERVSSAYAALPPLVVQREAPDSFPRVNDFYPQGRGFHGRTYAGFGCRWVEDDRGASWRFWETELTAPPWCPLLVFGLIGGILSRRVVRWRRAAGRARDGMCMHCGYDLRASTGRCPECGRGRIG